jgi:methylisocitrate lyase
MPSVTDPGKGGKGAGESEMKKTKLLKSLLETDEILVMPGCFNALSALLIEQSGFKAIYISGAAIASNYLGLPDLGLTTMTEILDNARNIVNVTDIPVVCDVDTGFGNVLNVVRTIREFENAGIAGVQIEDQVIPKKCGHIEGKMLITKEEMVQKIKACVDTRIDTDFLIIARTDALAVNGLQDALSRGLAYREAGADVIFVEAPKTIEEMKKITETIDAPHLANMVEGGGKTPILPLQELKEIGYRIVIYPGSMWMAAIKAMQEVLAILKKDGTTARFSSRMIPFKAGCYDLFEVVKLSKFKNIEKKYSISR